MKRSQRSSLWIFQFQDITATTKNEASELNPLSQAGQLFHDAHSSMEHSLSCTDPQLNSSMWQWQWVWTPKETTFCILIQAKGRREGMGFSPAALLLNSRTPWESACTVLIESYYFTQHCIQCQQRYKKERGSILWFVDPLGKKEDTRTTFSIIWPWGSCQHFWPQFPYL